MEARVKRAKPQTFKQWLESRNGNNWLNIRLLRSAFQAGYRAGKRASNRGESGT